MSYHCECEQCKNKEFNPEDYIIKEEDFKVLDKERPLGISGHLRVKDEAMSIAECIDSCIDALDELIITYNKSTDDTEEILKDYEKKYPDKIRLYYYAPNIIGYNENEYKTKYSEIHYFYHYSNFGYLKIKYRYYIKIDADQIYFTEKLLDIREALLSDINASETINKLLTIDKISWYIPIKKLRNNFRTYYIKKLFNIKDKYYNFNCPEYFLSLKDFIIYSKMKYTDNFYLLISGFELGLNNDSLCLNTSFVYNGATGDHFIFVPTQNYTYYLNSVGLESIHLPHNCSVLGLSWVHLGLIKRSINIDSEIKFMDIHKMNNEDILKYIENNLEKKEYQTLLSDLTIKYFDNDKQYLNKEFYDKYLKKTLEYVIKNRDQFIKRLW
ncbi:hypothetical protein Bint_2192 [Brachyspira intermedia PWS/A]|uniref:Uncharacterized protein n=1 Tax=Brachyspira intermedia (strain ATCC 51140 / PWS/A) TaxID=1045858 RepID=G0ELV1_BRAIP|nr:glycosyltransferase [Brachyspira intermedia]AEM22800.1 hypothetical protein Bint_2192 [Brachyspira intermedia PWS/A]